MKNNISAFKSFICVLAALSVYNIAEAQPENGTGITVPAGTALDDLMTPEELQETMVQDGAIDLDRPRLWNVVNGEPRVRVLISRNGQEIMFTAPELQSSRSISVPSRRTSDTGEVTFANRTYDMTQNLVNAPDGQTYFRSKVSTGGTLKQPSNLVKRAYCASTPLFNGFIPAGGRMHRDYKSRTFQTEEGDGVAMPWAIHVTGGIFLHEVPGGAVDKLGENVSGGCVRLPKKTAEILFELMRKHGGIQLEIMGDNPRTENTCTIPPELVAERNRLRALCNSIGRGTLCYKRDLEQAIAMGRIPPGSGPRQIQIARPAQPAPAQREPPRTTGGWSTTITSGTASR